MAIHSKHYYLFGWRVWSVILEVEEAEEPDELEVEEETPDSYSLNAQVTGAGTDVPLFGFVDHKNLYEEEEQ